MARGASHDETLLPAARRYADALLAAARDQGQIAAVSEDLVRLREAIEADPAAVRAIEAKLMPGRHALVRGVLGVLLARRRAELLPFLFRGYAEALEREEALLKVEVQTATPLEAAVKADIEQKLRKATGRPLALTAEVRPEILGGMRFVIDSRLIDASVRSRLDRLRKNMLAART